MAVRYFIDGYDNFKNFMSKDLKSEGKIVNILFTGTEFNSAIDKI